MADSRSACLRSDARIEDSNAINNPKDLKDFKDFNDLKGLKDFKDL